MLMTCWPVTRVRHQQRRHPHPHRPGAPGWPTRPTSSPPSSTKTGAVLGSRSDPADRQPGAKPSRCTPAMPGVRFPGCDRAPEWCERHHIIPWIEGGETNLNDLTLLCRYHHHNFTSRGWTGRINSDGIPEWTPPRYVDRDQKPIINTRITAMHAARIDRRN